MDLVGGGEVRLFHEAAVGLRSRNSCAFEGMSKLLADATTARVPGEIWFEVIDSKEMELHKDRKQEQVATISSRS